MCIELLQIDVAGFGARIQSCRFRQSLIEIKLKSNTLLFPWLLLPQQYDILSEYLSCRVPEERQVNEKKKGNLLPPAPVPAAKLAALEYP